MRPLQSVSAQPLTGSDGAEHPFWSPDSRWIGFFAEGKLRKMEASGGPTQTLCDAAQPRGGAWNQSGVILYSDLQLGLFRVPAQGGTPAPVASIDQAHGQNNDRWPVFLPDGNAYLHVIRANDPNVTGIYLSRLDNRKRVRLIGDLSSPAYSQGRDGVGYLVFVRAGTLMAQALDPERDALTGHAFPLAEPVGQDGVMSRSHFSISAKGVLVYDSLGDSGARQMVWLDRSGARLSNVGEPNTIFAPALSPDERTVAFRITREQASDLWLSELRRGVVTKFTFDPGTERDPVWSPDSTQIVYSHDREGAYDLYLKSSSGAAKPELLFKSSNNKHASDWSASAGAILYREADPKTKDDVWALPLQGDRKPVPLLRTEFSEFGGAFSPDGKYFAYPSNQSGRYEVYVQTYLPTGAMWQVSKSGGFAPLWRRDGWEIFFVAAGGAMMAAEVSPGATFRIGTPAPLFDSGIWNILDRYAVTGDGKRFLLGIALAANTGPGWATVVQNVFEGVRR